MYSFIQPRRKHILKNDTKFWLAFLTISLGMLAGFSIFLHMKVSDTIEEAKQTIEQRSVLIEKTKQALDEHESLRQVIDYSSQITMANELLSDNIKNIFDIVPDQVTLKKIEISTNCLSIYGITPSREVFNYHFAPALRSIFTTSQTSFISKGGGWSEFISTNKLEQHESNETVAQSPKEHEQKGDQHAVR